MVNRWWVGNEDERYWMEVTNRPDLGTDLNAPLYDDSGKENWRYTLLRELRRGDTVFHYHSKDRLIVGHSYVRSEAVEAEVLWAARGTSARERGTRPHLRPGLRVELEELKLFDRPISLEEIRDKQEALMSAKEALSRRYSGGTLYAPFELSESRPARMLQGYIFKFPADYLRVLRGGAPPKSETIEGLDDGLSPSDESSEEPIAEEIDVPIESLPEGAVKQIMVNKYERNPRARRLCLQHWGYACSVCGFDFETTYGQRGREFIHVHHLVPVAEIGQNYEVHPVNDLRPVCPNCHAMIHKTRPPCSIEDLRELLVGER